jgi:hypothetical protein
LCSKLQCEPQNTSSHQLLAAYEAYHKLYNEEIQAILLADKTKSHEGTSYQDERKKLIKELAQKLHNNRLNLGSRATELGTLLGLVSLKIFFLCALQTVILRDICPVCSWVHKLDKLKPNLL